MPCLYDFLKLPDNFFLTELKKSENKDHKDLTKFSQRPKKKKPKKTNKNKTKQKKKPTKNPVFSYI